MALDIIIVFMRVTNRTWPANDIVDVHPIEKDPGAGEAIHPKHAIMVVRNIPVPRAAFPKIKALLIQENLLVDSDPAIILDRRRWRFSVANLTAARRNAIRNKGRLDIDWADLAPVLTRKKQGTISERKIRAADLDG